jgi:UDP-galactopyranose mutase
MKKIYDYIVVGAGFFGSVIAERIASQSNYSVLLIDNKNHIGGNCYSEIDRETGIEYHKYGPHIFHTSSKRVWQYIRKFTEFNSYSHKVLSNYKGCVYTLPINLSLINKFFGLSLSPLEAEQFIESKQKKKHEIRNFEDLALVSIGRELYKAFIKDYTCKQWGRNPKMLPADNFSRIPIRFSYYDCYYDDTWCGIPLEGYAKLFKRMLSNKNIDLLLNTDYLEINKNIKFKRKLIYSGPIDKYFGYAEGKLNYRTAEITYELHHIKDYQGTSVMNYPEPCYEYTRIIEPKHFHPERKHKNVTFIQKEIPREDYDGANPLWPVNTEDDRTKLRRYQALARKEENVIFGGRLGMYRYFDMDDVIELALELFETKIKKQ